MYLIETFFKYLWLKPRIISSYDAVSIQKVIYCFCSKENIILLQGFGIFSFNAKFKTFFFDTQVRQMSTFDDF